MSGRVFVVVGGQYGSEGKGKLSAYMTERYGVRICVRTGGPNAGHCFETEDGRVLKLKQLPAGAVYDRTRILIPAGAVVDLDILRAEMNLLQLDDSRVGIDRNAMILNRGDAQAEADMFARISSTQSGVGAATARRVMRGDAVVLARDVKWLKPYITDVSQELGKAIGFKNILIEGTQGFGLSLYHSKYYPKATSRDTSAAGVISEAGISPLAVTDIVMAIRTFPIRVAGQQAGPLFAEMTWEDVRRQSGYSHSIEERTTVTNRVRRVGNFDYGDVLDAIRVNRPTALAVGFLDYLDCRNRGCRSAEALTPLAKDFCVNLEGDCGVPVGIGGTGPKIKDMVEF